MMKTIKAYDIFELPNNNSDENIVCVTTNGIIKHDSTAVMGAGIAKTANIRFNVAKKLADNLRNLTYVENTDNIDDDDYDNSYLVNEHGEPIGDNDANTKGPYRALIKAIAKTLCHYNSDKIDLVYNDEYLAIMYHSQYNSFLIENVCNKNDIDENIVIEIADGFNIGHAF